MPSQVDARLREQPALQPVPAHEGRVRPTPVSPIHVDVPVVPGLMRFALIGVPLLLQQ